MSDATELSITRVIDAPPAKVWEIAPVGNRTRYTARARHWIDEDTKRHVEMGFEQGWSACADQLKELCER